MKLETREVLAASASACWPARPAAIARTRAGPAISAASAESASLPASDAKVEARSTAWRSASAESMKARSAAIAKAPASLSRRYRERRA